ncbi:MAG: iron-sulfur cluster assembly scaffold protein, partial [Candidatus Omnitrophica bacterium]|nr:iron-sulfur cluster assembly scaffold protein [Candidatus Omnitrophota bacterium]
MPDKSRLYQQLVIQHSQHPQNYREIPDPTHSAKGYNRVCGDAITIYLKVANDRITDVSFQGDCCAVCKCSASLLTKRAKGGSVQDFGSLFDCFKTMLEQDVLPP